MSARNASRATTAVDGDDPRDCEQLGRRLKVLRTRKSSGRQVGLPDTAMAAAFLGALMRWAKRRPNTDAKIAIPTGTVTAGELVRVVRALGFTRNDRKRSS